MSDWVFQPFILMVREADHEIIAMKFIESMTILRDSEDAVVEKLKGDAHLMCRMVSGKEYKVSMLAQAETFVKYKLPTDVLELRQCIFEKWYHMVSN